MKWFLNMLALAIFAVLLTPTAHASAVGGSRFEKVIYISSATDTSTKNARNDGRDYASAKGFMDGDLWAIPAGVIIENVYVVVDVAVVGPTKFDIGDDDTASGFIASSSPLAAPDNLGDLGLHYWNVDYKGTYLKGGTIVTTGWKAKHYSATGKEVKLDVTGTASAGKVRVFITGSAPAGSGL